MFEEEQITLDIPEEGVMLESGWTITPHTYPGVSLDYTVKYVSIEHSRSPRCSQEVSAAGC